MFEIILFFALQCDGDKCVVVPDPAPKSVIKESLITAKPQRSVVVKRTRVRSYAFPVIREVQPARKLARGTLKVARRAGEIARYGLKGGAKVIAMPFRAARHAHCNSLARRAGRGNPQASRRLGKCK